MLQCFDLARKGWPLVAPNPMVGCVIVKNDIVVAQGYHEKFGSAHAEVNAIKNLPVNISPADCTLYVNLEPCSHHGKTPPCADLIISKGFKRVVISNSDPNPLVSGRGIQLLRNAGIEVITGILEKEGADLNKRFFTFHQKKRPYYILKWAQSADGFISRLPVPENRKDNMIGDEEQQKLSHMMRAGEMAIMVGKNTVLCDNPGLTTRLVEGKNPLRIVIDNRLEVPPTFSIYNSEAPTIIFNSLRNEEKNNIKFIRLDFSDDVLDQVSDALYKMNIQSVIVEGGAFLLNEFIRKKLYDETRVFVNEKLLLGNGVKAPVIIAEEER
jgi:diaminohydroxyphosphoribosylaminopyrimidine deaminase/5-amino-6-(5-phosphoribosylamino)uracil reductase